MMHEFTPPSDADFEQFMTEAEKASDEPTRYVEIEKDSLARMYHAIAETNTDTYIPECTENHSDAFTDLCNSIARSRRFGQDSELTAEQEAAILTTANNIWDREAFIQQYVLEAIADYHHSDLATDERENLKYRVSTVLIALELDADKWVPVLNHAIGGEAFDDSRPDHHQYLERIKAEIQQGSPFDEEKMSLQLQLELTYIYNDDDPLLRVEKTVAINKLVFVILQNILNEESTETLYENIDSCLRESELLYAQRHDIILLCNKSIVEFQRLRKS